ncbi:MAG TPA: ATP-binding protein, partial [Polyangia bacterium]
MLRGRSQALESLQAAFGGGDVHRARVVWLRGPSGIGKSALARAFVETLDGGALALTGRCVRVKRAPFESIEGWIRGLEAALPPDGVAERIAPEERAALVRLFPAFARAQPPSADAPSIRDVQELRRRAFAALRALVASV